MDKYLYFTPHTHKLAVVRTLHTRAETISSTVLHKDEEVRHVRQALSSNGYPIAVMKNGSVPTRTTSADSQKNHGPVVTLLYAQGVFEVVLGGM